MHQLLELKDILAGLHLYALYLQKYGLGELARPH